MPVDETEHKEDFASQQRDRRANAPRLLKYLIKTCDSIEALDKDDRIRIRTAQVTATAYYDGRQDGKVVNGNWRDNETIEGEIKPQDNQYKIQIDKLHMEMCRGKVRYESEPAVKTPESDEANRFLQWRIDTAQDRIETEPFLQAENMSLLLKLVTFRYTHFDPTQPGEAEATVPNVGKVAGKEHRTVVCRTCGRPQAKAENPPEVVNSELPREGSTETEIETAKAAPCEWCGDTESREIVLPPSEGLNVTYEQMPGGQVTTVRPDATMVQLDMNARDIPTSRFLRWRMSLRRCEWEAMFPGRVIPSGERSDEARYAADLQGHASNDTGWGLESEESETSEGGSQFEKIEGDFVWLDPVVYQDYRCKEDEVLRGGQVLPKGTSPTSIYQPGMCVVRIGPVVMDLYPSDKDKCWSMCVYGLREHALHGSGTLSLLGPQDTINDLKAYIHANAYYNAAGREFVRPGMFPNGLPKLNQMAEVANLADDKPIIGYAYDKSTPNPLSGEVYQFFDEQKGSLQEHAGTSSLSMQGAADMRALGTATGVEASRDQAVGRMIPNRKLQAAMGKEWITQVAELERENLTPEMFLPAAGASEKGEVKFTERGVRAFFKMDVRRDFRIRPAEGSWVPTTPQQQKANAMAFAQIAQQIQNPEILSMLAPSFNVEYDVNEWGAAQRAASLRLQEMARISGVITQHGYPPSPEMVEVVLSQLPLWAQVNPELDPHQSMLDFLEDWAISDEGTNADDLLRLTVERVHALHRDGITYQATKANEGAMAAQLPAQQAQMAVSALDHEQSMVQAEDTRDAERQATMEEVMIAKAMAEGGEEQVEAPVV